jgi:F-type H+-transporting ATPase subunit epsilon
MENRTIFVRVVSQEAEVFQGEVKAVFCRSFGGDLGIYPGHSQLLSLIRPGAVRLEREGAAEVLLYVSGGILEIQPSMVSILADVIERPEDVNQFAAEEALAEAKALLAQGLETAKADEEKALKYYQAQQDLEEATARLRVLGLAQGNV